MATEPCGEGCEHLNTYNLPVRDTDTPPVYPDRVVELNQTVYDKLYDTLDSGVREQYESGMQRDTTEGKIKWHLIASGPMLRRWAELMTRGAVKYDDDNWLRADSVDEYSRFRASAFRHFMQWYYGDVDEDHAAAVMFNMNGAEYTNDMMNERLSYDN